MAAPTAPAQTASGGVRGSGESVCLSSDSCNAASKPASWTSPQLTNVTPLSTFVTRSSLASRSAIDKRMNAFQYIRRRDSARNPIDDVGFGQHREDAGDLLQNKVKLRHGFLISVRADPAAGCT